MDKSIRCCKNGSYINSTSPWSSKVAPRLTKISTWSSRCRLGSSSARSCKRRSQIKDCRCSPSSSLSRYLSKMGSSLTTCCVADDRIDARWALKSLDWKYRFQNCSSESFNQSIQYCWFGLINMRPLHFVGYVFIVGLSHNRVFVKDIMDELRGNSDLDLASFDGLRSRIHKLTWLAFPLAFRCCLS